MHTKINGSKKYGLVVAENAFADVLIKVKDSDLRALNLVKGTSSMMTDEQAALMEKLFAGYDRVIKPGGAGANVSAHSAGAGARTAFFGTVGTDEYGRFIGAEFKNCGVDACLKYELGKSGILFSLITPDGERTMVLDPGVALNYSVSDLNIAVLENTQIFSTSMYALAGSPQREAILLALEIVKKAGGKNSLDIANAPLAEALREFILELLGKHIDIVAGNEEEMTALFGSIEEAQKVLPGICETSIIKLGGKGSIILCGSETIRIPVFPAKVVDTTGAGDSILGVFLAMIAQGASIEEAGNAASKKAAEIVGRIGAR